MSSNFSRRRVLTVGAGVALGGIAAGTAGTAQAATAAAPVSGAPAGREETRSLDELYQDALAEGGKLVIYAGGDIDSQQAATRAAFAQRFPGIALTMVVDYSKYHDVRVDNQFATDTLVPDVVQLQTLQDFTRWKAQRRLLPYRAAGYSAQHPQFRDSDGAWTTVVVSAFSFMYDVAAAGADAPRTPLDLVDPRWKGAIASAFPHDDDAVLYLFSRYQEAYGWDWVAKFAAQQPQFARGSFSGGAAVSAKQKIIGVGTGGSLTAPSTAPAKWIAPDGHPFVAWAGGVGLAPEAAGHLARHLADPEAVLSEREIQVVRLLAEGGSNRSIAAALILTEATVKTHLVRIYRKLGTENRASTVSEAVRRGLLEVG
jgi:ABC-type Fe3+ transport system substrate-binding protein